ncbi:MAG: ribosome small subunit-dependent GTPase A [bacterium]|nr:ribosome small subunit-dependent GTPase A [bacterium]
MDSEEKAKQVARHLRGMKKYKTIEEQKLIKNASRKRQSERGERKRDRRDWSEWDDDEDGQDAGFERIQRARPTDLTRKPREPEGTAGPVTDAEHDAVVVSLTSGRARVLVGGEELEAQLAQHLAETQQSSVAVGDEVALEERPDAQPRVVSVAPRRSELSRPDPGRPERERVLAANVEVAVIVVAARRAALRVGIVERMALALGRGGAQPLACINKVDLWETPERRADAELALEPLAAAGIGVHFVSAERGDGVVELAAAIEGRTTVFIGHSGVGKSSLLNAIDPDHERAVKHVREADQKGRHTTTASSLTVLGGGTRVIDTPGIRAFGMWGFERESLRAWFTEFDELAASCKFRDCVHAAEPGCAVRAAAEEDALLEARYRTYLRILDEL